MEATSGLGKLDRKRLSEIIRGTKGTISVDEAASILNISSSEAGKILSRLCKKVWLSRLRRGLYIPVSIESRTTDVPLEDPWIVVQRLYAPCYIGGWSAAEYWDLTEQIFRTIVVMTVQRPRNRSPIIAGTKFLIRTVQNKAMFGMRQIWRGQVQAPVSDPSRTILDLMVDPGFGGGIRPSVDIFMNYLKSKERNIALLAEYAEKLGNGAVFKRLGFLLERFTPDEKPAIEKCLVKLTKGNAKLDPALDEDKLVTRWRLWLPKGWHQENINGGNKN